MQDDAAALAATFHDHGYSTTGVRNLLGQDAFAALGRGELQPARQALAGGTPDPLADLVRLFLLGEALPLDRIPSAAVALGLLEDRDGVSRSRWQIAPHGEHPVVSDFQGSILPRDHVTGVGGASVTLATITPRAAVARTLDLGTGCGIQALLATDHSGTVVATDLSHRAIAAAELTFALAGRTVDLRKGSLFEPVAGEQFDLIVANPPFVITPAARHTYREAEYPDDALSRAVVRRAAEHLAPGGVAVVLANWLHCTGEPWQQRLSTWGPDDCQVWAVQREYLPASEYVELWLRDSGELGTDDYADRYERWYRYLVDLDAAGVGFGWIVVRRSGPAWFVAEDLADSERLPDGDEVLAQLDRHTLVQGLSAMDLLGSSVRWRPEAELHLSLMAADGQPTDMVATGPWRPAMDVDRLVGELLGQSGTVRERLAALPDDATVRALIGLRQLISAGLVELQA